MSRDTIGKLETILKNRFDRLYAEADGSAHPERLVEVVRDWHAHICSLGMHLSGSVGNQGVYIPDPGCNFWRRLGQDGYICAPEELAMKILALGKMP